MIEATDRNRAASKKADGADGADRATTSGVASGTRGKAGAQPAGEVPPRVASLLVTPAGRLAAVVVFTAMLALTASVAWQGVGLVLALTSVFPAQRRLWLALAAVGAAALAPPLRLDILHTWGEARGGAHWTAMWPAVVAATVAFGIAWVHVVRRFPRSPVGRRPVLWLLVLLVALLVAAADAPLGGLAWFLVVAFSMSLGSYVWFFAYAASESRLRGAPPPQRQIGYWRPFWGFSNVPLGKGAAYLERVEASDDDALARAQWSALRLLAWATVLTIAMDAFRWAVYAPQDGAGGGGLIGWLPAEGLPPLALVLDRQVEGDPYPFAIRWASVLAEFVVSILYMTTWGHKIIAICRMAGYQAALNTDRPLLSTSVSDFYNRFYWYFKELLATFFFYPTYLRYFRTRPKVRLFVATVAAAGFGNFLFHFLRDSHEIYRLGVLEALFAYRAYGCYALVLGVAIGVSQIRLLARHRREPQGLRRVVATAGVVAFYCLLGVMDVRTPHDLADYGRFYLSLFVP